MRELRLRVPAAAVEHVLDQLLPLVPGGVREVPDGGVVELRMRGDELPPMSEIVRAAERWPHRVTEAEVPDDWRARRALDYVPDMIAGRLVVRPEWAPPSPEAEIEIVLADHAGAFGAGTHPTTRVCLELLLQLEPAGKFADLGCGSGVLAILAAKRGWDPVVAVDVQPASAEATRQNAAANRVAIDATVADLSLTPPPPSDGFAANVPAHLHALVAGALPDPRPMVALLSGFGRADADATVRTYAARGFREMHRSEPHGWVVSLLERGR